jgi:hypothetical protein
LSSIALAAGKRNDSRLAILVGQDSALFPLRVGKDHFQEVLRNLICPARCLPPGIEISKKRIGPKDEIATDGIQDDNVLADRNWDSERQHR